MHSRQSTLTTWLKQAFDFSEFSLNLLTGDASFRRYYRLHCKGKSYIVMDAPPQKETLKPFIEIADFFRAHGLLTPKIYAVNELEGFVLLDDFGDQLLLQQLTPLSADELYTSAIKTLLVLQQCPITGSYQFPLFDSAFIQSELNLFIEWFLTAYLKLTLTRDEKKLLDTTFAWLIAEINKQPQVVIHRDYHSRNIMLPGAEFNHQLAVIDFQDAMRGPFTYDLVSLLKDCYIQWPREQIMRWLTLFYEQSPLTKQENFPSFLRAFDLCGLQRHLKVLGIFCRLYLRDNKPNYLQHLPLTLHYVISCLETYDELKPFYHFIQQRIQLP
ncbi:putative phosphotransferase [Legionella beliardensis]|uniref:Putative phosphotransferase n=1 Tax=Legionella beliardensis TaxID=91822 RepID=A0A378HXW4_9GAMM|nr:phosphotransferase [Legionella beliardensis]STX27729.1 putative phosphotransferase [Legionella beliardensis]